MGKLFRLSDYVLLSAAVAGDFLESTRTGWGVMPAAMKNMYGFVPPKWKYKSYISSVSKLLSTGDIKKRVDKSGKVFLELSPGGKDKFRRRFPIFMQKKLWDGYFMIVTYDIPERSRFIRSNLRLKLEELGFGKLQKSVWISPYHFEEDMQEFLIKLDLNDKVFVLTARKLLLGDPKSFADNIWKLKKINKKYTQVIKIVKNAQLSRDYKKPKLAKKAFNLYLDTLAKDPLLPKEFLPGDWKREVALRFLVKK